KSMFTGQERFFFFPAIKATFYYVAVSVPLGIVFSFFVAVLLNQKVRGLGLFRSIFYLPVVIPLASTTLIWIWILQPNFGIANYLLQSVGLPPSTFLSSDTTFIPTLILFSIWLCGSTIIIFLAGLQSIPSHLYESIEIDGGNSWHKMLYVTIPLSSSVIFMNTVIGFINALQTFVQPTLMGGTAGTTTAGATGGPDLSGFLYVLYIFQSAFRFSRMGAASAAAVILIIVSIVLTYLIFKFSKSMVYYEGDGKNK
ncbi:MAG TPA: sugar ABC transporter permease, partial [Bacilli bacterium]